MVLREAWPHCGSRRDKRNGYIHTGKQHHRGRACGRDFVRNPGNHSVPEEQCLLIKRLLTGKYLAARDRPCGGRRAAVALTITVQLHVASTRLAARACHLPFSKKLSNHIGAIKYFICDDNLTKCAALPG